VFSMACEGPIANSLGLVARRLGRPLEALRHFEHATERADALGLRPSAAISRCHWAETLLEHGSRDDVARVRPLLEAARETAAELSMSSLSERIDALFAKLPAEAGAEIAIHTAHSKKTPFELVSEGEVWAVRFGSTLFRLKDSKGVQTLARLVENAGRELHVLELVGTDEGVRDGGDSGELLDAQARDEYRRRLETLDELIEEAEGFGDAARASRAREEREQIATEIARAVGLGGRTRRAGSAAERARTAIQRRLKDAIQRIGEQCPPLRRHLESSLRTGTFCSYRPIDE